VEIWPQAVVMLEEAPDLEAKALFEYLWERSPWAVQEKHLRTFQRRVKLWRLQYGPDKEVFFPQDWEAGRAMQLVRTPGSELAITIAGQPYEYQLWHSVLPHSYCEWATRCLSESLLSLRQGLQESLHRLGKAPGELRMDHSSAATHRVGGGGAGREFNEQFVSLCKHYGLVPRTIGINCPNENGDVESSNGHLKRRLRQHLLLRGSRDFVNLAEYEQFLGQVMSRRNERRQERLNEELAVMKPLTVEPLGSYQEFRVKVSRGSLIRVQKNVYSVPTSLIGRIVAVRVYEWHLEIYFRQYLVEQVARVVGQNRQQLNYRHLIDSLLRKPGGFRDYRYREALFPTLVFRQAWEALNRWHSPRKADLIYLRLLRLAARTLESEVEAALSLLLAGQQPWDETDVEQLMPGQSPPLPVPQLALSLVNLAQYDALLREMAHVSA
jgi:hypothetical protein